jgi:hypothetical protein
MYQMMNADYFSLPVQVFAAMTTRQSEKRIFKGVSELTGCDDHDLKELGPNALREGLIFKHDTQTCIR